MLGASSAEQDKRITGGLRAGQEKPDIKLWVASVGVAMTLLQEISLLTDGGPSKQHICEALLCWIGH